MLGRTALAALLAVCSSAALADGATPSDGYTSLQQSYVVHQTSAPQFTFVPGMTFNGCGCCGQTTHISGFVITSPGVESTRQSWGANG